MFREVIIYTLTNPFTLQIYYVGQTTNLKRRHEEHGYCLIEKGDATISEKPIIEEIDRCYYYERLSVEEYWTCQLKAWGFDLRNCTITKVRYKPEGRRYISEPTEPQILKAFSDYLVDRFSLKQTS